MDWVSQRRYLHRFFIADLKMADGTEVYAVPRDLYPDLVSKAVAWRPSKLNPRYFQDAKAIRYVKDGEYYREDGPALIWNDGTCFWYENARCWKIERPDGTVEFPGKPNAEPAKVRPSRDNALADLIDAIEASGHEADAKIISKMTIAEAEYFSKIIDDLVAEEAWEQSVRDLQYRVSP